ncbi:MAG: hypothetical protein ACXWRE_09110 [Pseudobdellovibrionaceae bacterium]
MNKRNIFTEEVIEALCDGQKISEQEMQKIREENNGMPDGILVTFVQIYFRRNAATTDWKRLLNGIEQILVKNANEEQIRIVTHNILEGFANAAANGALDAKWITPHLGQKSRDYLNEYEKFHGSGVKF